MIGRRLGVAAATVVALVLASFSVEAAQRKAKGPRMEIDPEDYDFGAVAQNEKLVHEFTIRNEGTEDLVIRRIATSCGCTAAITSDRTVPPGETTILAVTLETRKYKGVVVRSVSVASNDPRRVRTVRVRAFVESLE